MTATLSRTSTPGQATKRDLAEKAMRRSWFPVARITDLGTPQRTTLLGEKLVVYRNGAGTVTVRSRRCPHRGGDLAGGEVLAKAIACPYHGWEFDSGTGGCTRVPSLPDQSK